jgi:hypothetical protein
LFTASIIDYRPRHPVCLCARAEQREHVQARSDYGESRQVHSDHANNLDSDVYLLRLSQPCLASLEPRHRLYIVPEVPTMSRGLATDRSRDICRHKRPHATLLLLDRRLLSFDVEPLSHKSPIRTCISFAVSLGRLASEKRDASLSESVVPLSRAQHSAHPPHLAAPVRIPSLMDSPRVKEQRLRRFLAHIRIRRYCTCRDTRIYGSVDRYGRSETGGECALWNVISTSYRLARSGELDMVEGVRPHLVKL